MLTHTTHEKIKKIFSSSSKVKKLEQSTDKI